MKKTGLYFALAFFIYSFSMYAALTVDIQPSSAPAFICTSGAYGRVFIRPSHATSVAERQNKEEQLVASSR